MKNLRDLTYEDLVEEVKALGEKPYRAHQLFAWVYKRRAPAIDSMTDISKDLRERLKDAFYIGGVNVLDVMRSADGTRKMLSSLEDGSRIETVLIPEGERLTLCVSSQAGCPLGCRFCMTGQTGFIRNLKLSELSAQVIAAEGEIQKGEKITNIVLMGMGEPLLNYENVLKFLKILVDSRGFGFSHNKITVSTSGIVPAIEKLGKDIDVNLAVSLNASTDEIRARLMPVARKYTLKDLLAALKSYPLPGKKHITFEYVLIKDVNDSIDDARRLARLLRGIKCKINLIPFNPFPGSIFDRPSDDAINAFWEVLKGSHYKVFVRESKGRDIQAACGQLSGLYNGGAPAEGVLPLAPEAG